MSDNQYTPGMRVAVVQSIEEGKVHLYGYGVYEGDFPYDEESAEVPPVGLVSILAQKAGIETNPRLKLDNGQTVWGCECWWCPIEKLKEEYGELEIVAADIDKDRKIIMGEEEAETEEAS